MTNTNSTASMVRGTKVTDRNTGKHYTVVRSAKPLEFWITGGGEPFGRVETVDAVDLIEGDDISSFDGEFRTRVRVDSLVLRAA